MPLYEYYCRQCTAKFELLRPLSRMEEPASCPKGHVGGERLLSPFAALSKGNDGEVNSVGGSGCAGCAGGSCSCHGVN